MDAISKSRAGWRHPGRLATELLALADAIASAGYQRTCTRRTIIVTGETGSGKTTLVREAVTRLRARGADVAGILAPGLFEHGRRTGFLIVDLATGASTALAGEHDGEAGPHARWSRFAFRPEGLSLGELALGPSAENADVIVIDEVGPFELSGGGWASALDRLAHDYEGTMLLVARAAVVDAVRARWGSPDTVVCEESGTTADMLTERILNTETVT